MRYIAPALAALALVAGAAPVFVEPAGAQMARPQMEPVPDRPAGEGEGPFAALLITGATMIDGSGRRRSARSTSSSKAIASPPSTPAARPPR